MPQQTGDLLIDRLIFDEFGNYDYTEAVYVRPPITGAALLIFNPTTHKPDSMPVADFIHEMLTSPDLATMVGLMDLPEPEPGETGATGPQGIQGIQGIKGDTGTTGSAGTNGTNGANATTTATATTSVNGLMSATDKTKLDGVSTKRRETYSGTSAVTTGAYSVTFPTAFSSAPNIQANIINPTDTQSLKITNISTTGFTVVARNRTDVIGLLPAFSNASGLAIDVLITEK